MINKAHWERVYEEKSATQVSWYQKHPQLSLECIARTGVDKSGQIIDVGGGSSMLVDYLIDDRFQNITVLDISGAAIQLAKERLRDRGASVSWFETDITRANLPRAFYDVWHDRAVFHFLTSPDDRERYREVLRHSVKPGGQLIVATFALDGPSRCSGLAVERYNAETLRNEFAGDFELLSSATEQHHTPSGSEQKFVYCCLQKFG